jgi:hypothetical protein
LVYRLIGVNDTGAGAAILAAGELLVCGYLLLRELDYTLMVETV